MITKKVVLKQNIQLIKDRINRNNKEIARMKKVIKALEQDTLNHESILAYTEAELTEGGLNGFDSKNSGR